MQWSLGAREPTCGECNGSAGNVTLPNLQFVQFLPFQVLPIFLLANSALCFALLGTAKEGRSTSAATKPIVLVPPNEPLFVAFLAQSNLSQTSQ